MARTPTQLGLDYERAARDKALDLLEEHRPQLIELASNIAARIALRNGSVTSIEVFAQMESDGIDLGKFDKRWMGAVFREGKGWKRIGWEATGSHGRPVARWVLTVKT